MSKTISLYCNSCEAELTPENIRDHKCQQPTPEAPSAREKPLEIWLGPEFNGYYQSEQEVRDNLGKDHEFSCFHPDYFYNELKRDYEQLAEKLAVAQNVLQEWKTNWKNESAKNQEFQREVEYLTEQVDALDQAHDITRAEKKELQTKITEQAAEIERLRSALKDIEMSPRILHKDNLAEKMQAQAQQALAAKGE